MSNQLFTEVSVEQQEIVTGGNTTVVEDFVEESLDTELIERETFSFFTTSTTEETGLFERSERVSARFRSIGFFSREESSNGGDFPF